MKWIDFILVKVPIENLSFALKVLWIGHCIIVLRLTVDLTMDFEKLSVPAHMEQHMVVWVSSKTLIVWVHGRRANIIYLKLTALSFMGDWVMTFRTQSKPFSIWATPEMFGFIVYNIHLEITCINLHLSKIIIDQYIKIKRYCYSSWGDVNVRYGCQDWQLKFCNASSLQSPRRISIHLSCILQW